MSVNKTYENYIRGMQADIFIKRQGIPYLGKVWPGLVYYPDSLNPHGQTFWDEMNRFRDHVLYDGIDPPYKINNSGSQYSINTRTVPASPMHFGNITA